MRPEDEDHSGATMPLLTPHLGTVDQVYQKVLREHYRTWHARDFVHKADHFYNFCITAHSLRDYFLEHKGWGGDRENRRRHRVERREQHRKWDSEEVLLAVKEIANSAKHFCLRNAPETKATEETTATAVDVYVESEELSCVEVVIPDLVVTTASGKEYHLWEMMSEATDYWRQFLTVAEVPLAGDPHYFPGEAGSASSKRAIIAD